mmetsp:Transcript_38677/g.76015  ORF Transcript_38677/g.76015 Transcript_38677/m.76015 type:complete len:113 (+) Transcript_38677:1795-2133(+)
MRKRDAMQKQKRFTYFLMVKIGADGRRERFVGSEGDQRQGRFMERRDGGRQRLSRFLRGYAAIKRMKKRMHAHTESQTNCSLQPRAPRQRTPDAHAAMKSLQQCASLSVKTP